MDAIPELNLPGLSPTAARTFASDGGLIPDGAPPEIYMYHPRDLQDEYRESSFRKRISHYLEGRCFADCAPCMIWLLTGWSQEFGTFCLERVNAFITTLEPGSFDNVRFQAPQDVTKCIYFLWDFILLHSWTPMLYSSKAANMGITKLPKSETGAGNSTKTSKNTVDHFQNNKMATVWCKIQAGHLVRRLDACYAPSAPVFSERSASSKQMHQYYDPPLVPVPPPDKHPGFGAERNEVRTPKDMREAAKKISAKEFVHSDMQTLLRKTDISSLVERYFHMLDKGEFKFLERMPARGNFLGGFV